jgi:hypothetical protein
LKYLGYIFLFYVGFYFYRLAENHKKNKWLFSFLGVFFFISAYFIYVLFCRFFNPEEFVENLPSIGIKAFFVGLISSIIIFQILSFVWNRKKKHKINEIGMPQEKLEA